jgi:hypothetical protein
MFFHDRATVGVSELRLFIRVSHVDMDPQFLTREKELAKRAFS